MINAGGRTAFTAQRYELDGNHVYYLPPSVFSILERSVPTFLVGTRGTGKTTLLRALSWDERLNNPWLHDQLGNDPFVDHYIGLYFKLPNLQLALLEHWLREEEDHNYAAVMSFYLDLCWLEALLPAVEHLTAAKVVTITPDAQTVFNVEIDRLFSSGAVHIPCRGEPNRTIPDALSQMHLLRNLIERAARRRENVVEVIDTLPIGQVGSFGRAVGSLIAAAIESSDLDSAHKWSFRICMDEGEALTLRQQRVINSMVRVAEWPVVYVVAYVSRPLDVTSTLLPNQTLQIADRHIHLLDDISDKEFKALAEGVVNRRLAVTSSALQFSAKRTLGDLDLDGLLSRILGRSEGDFSQELLTRARELRPEADPPPLYEAYLRMRRPELERTVSGRARRRFSSASLRKQMVAAYLSICRELGAEPLYASADMVLQVSDKCMRDFLRTMEHIFFASQYTLEQFLTSEVSTANQNIGIKAAAELKMALFTERVVSSAAEATQFVDILGEATAKIQSTGRNAEQLRTPERGVFSYQRTEGGRVPSQSELLIRDAADGGFIKIMPDDSAREIRFRVHASLAPYYGFSYRGAYYSIGTLSDADIEAMRDVKPGSRAGKVRDQLVERITKRRTPKIAEAQPSLFEGLGEPE